MQSNTEWATIGKIVAPFGIRGELKVLSLSDIPDRFAQLDVVYLTPDHLPRKIKSVRPHKGEMVILKLAGIEDADVAETLRDRELHIPLAMLAILPPNSYYQHDIIGLHVHTLDEKAIGTITDIIVTGSNDVYIIKTASGQEVLIPAIKDIVKQVDLIRHMMYIDPIAGLLDNDAIIDEQDDLMGEEKK